MCECLVWSVSYFTHGVVDILCGQGPVWLLSVWWMLYIYQEYANNIFSESSDRGLFEMVVSFASVTRFKCRSQACSEGRQEL